MRPRHSTQGENLRVEDLLASPASGAPSSQLSLQVGLSCGVATTKQTAVVSRRSHTRMVAMSSEASYVYATAWP